MKKGFGLAAAIGLAVGYAARQANVLDGVVREGGVVDFGRLGGNLRNAACKVREMVSKTPSDRGEAHSPPSGSSPDDGA